MADIVYPGARVIGTLNAGAMPVNTNLVVYRGDFVELFVTIKDSAGVPMSLEGQIPKAQLKQDYDSIEAVDFVCQIIGSQVRIYLPSDRSTALNPGPYIWDFQLTNGDGENRTYLAGDVTVYNEVTT